MSFELPDEAFGLTQTEEALLDALEVERAAAASSSETAGIILHEIGNISMGLAASLDPSVLETFQRLRDTMEGLQLMFDHAKKIEYRTVNVREMLYSAMGNLRNSASVDVSRSSEYLNLCPSLISQVVFNIVRNGFKYAGDMSRVLLRAISDEEHLNLFIHNQGVPMCRNLARKLFKGRVTECHGMGLGLLICHKCTVRMNGTIAVRSHSQGTTFRIQVPVY